jgi:hypothetical protein
MSNLRARLGLKDGGTVSLRERLGLKDGGVVHMDKGGKLPPGVKRATEQVDKSAVLAAAKPARQAIQGYLGMDPSYSVMDPQAERLASAYRTGEATSVLGDIAGALSPFAYASAMSKVGQVPGIAELIAYHGSPHKFKKFDASKIGTGEGAQAFGHGLYFAEDPKVAKKYQADLSNFEQPYLQFGKTKIAGQDLTDTDLDVLKYLERGKRDAGQFPHNTVYYAKQAAKNNPEALKRLDEIGRDVKFGYEKNLGALYKVDIPDEKIAQMLDWDKPLSQQPKAVQEAINKSEYALRDMAMDLYGKKDPLGSEIARAALKPQEFAEHMRELGVPGIRYFDQGSRGTGKGTSNFVVFPGEEESIKMLEINGTPEMAAGGPVHMQDGGDPTARFMGKTPKRGVSALPGYGQGNILQDIEGVAPQVAGGLDVLLTGAPIVARALASPAVGVGTFVKEAIKSGDPRDPTPRQRAGEAAQGFITENLRLPQTEKGIENLEAVANVLEDIPDLKLPPFLPQMAMLPPTTGVAGALRQAAKTAGKEMLRPVDQAMRGEGMLAKPLQGVAPRQVMPSTMADQGVTYETTTEGPFYRVRPSRSQAAAGEGRGIVERVRDEAVAPGRTGSDVSQPTTDEAVKQAMSDPANFVRQAASTYTQETTGKPYELPDMPESSILKQAPIGRTFMLATTDDPGYKQEIFRQYATQMPEVIEQSGATNYDELLVAAYRQMAKETDEQFKRLPVSLSYHRAGEGNYRNSKQMLQDVYGNKHLYVFQGGDEHPFLKDVDPKTGLNENEKFRAVHDFFGHAIHGNEFGPKGEEIAWAAHSQMYSPLARLAMSTETRGQNSTVNYTPLNAALKRTINELQSLRYEANRRGQTEQVKQIDKDIAKAYETFQFAPQKPLLLPPEFLSTSYAGEMPDYLRPLIKPMEGTTVSTPMLHYSKQAGLTETDPSFYGTGIKGEEAARLGLHGAISPRTYFYAGQNMEPEVGLGPHKYRAMGENLYDLAADPLQLQMLARETTRIPMTSTSNKGLAQPAEATNALERLIRDYGYAGYLSPRLAKPSVVMFGKTPVQPYAKGGKVRFTGNPDVQAMVVRMSGGGDMPRSIMQAKGFGEGREDIEKALQAIKESAPVSAASQLASGYMSGAGGTDLEKIGQAVSMIPMIGLPATIGKASKLGKAVDVIGDVAQEASLANDYKAIPTAAFRREALARKAAEQERLRLQAPKEDAPQKTSVSVSEPAVKVEESPRVGNIASAKNFKAPQDKALLEAQRAAALPVEQGGLGLPPDNTPDVRAAAMGYQDFYHGTERLDRLLEKGALDPRRATSGPMPFGTESKQMASTYATSKRDTSRLAQDEGNVADYFTVSAKNLGYRSNQDIPVEKAFYFLPREKQQEIISKVKRIGYANPQEATGDLVLHPEGMGGSIMDPKTIDYYLQREAKGNPLTALRIMWHDSGTLYNNEEQLAKVFELAGFPFPISQKNAPWSSAQGVLTGKARLNNPLTTTDAEVIESRVIPALKQAFAKDRTRKQAYGPDQWAKNVRFTPKEWVAELEKDMAEGKNSYVWTSIPDKVTAELRKLGFDGIVDAGGKGGGAQHRVVIPFDTKQVRSRFAAFNPLKKDEPGLLKAKGGTVRFTDNPDVQAMVVKMAKELPKAVNKGKKYA